MVSEHKFLTDTNNSELEISLGRYWNFFEYSQNPNLSPRECTFKNYQIGQKVNLSTVKEKA